jgi:MOSC domain-containing protein YiiM
LFIAETAGAPVVSRASLEVLPGVGVVGDRYACGTGHWSDPRWPDQELTMLEVEVAEALALDAGSLRRNVVTRDIRLDALIGVQFRIGGTVLQGVRHCDPCLYLEQLLGCPGLLSSLAGRGGLRVRIVAGGRMHVGDDIVVLPTT